MPGLPGPSAEPFVDPINAEELETLAFRQQVMLQAPHGKRFSWTAQSDGLIHLQAQSSTNAGCWLEKGLDALILEPINPGPGGSCDHSFGVEEGDELTAVFESGLVGEAGHRPVRPAVLSIEFTSRGQ